MTGNYSFPAWPFGWVLPKSLRTLKKSSARISIPLTCLLPTSFSGNYNFRGSVITTQRLYELAARGICVVVGVKSLPREYELISQVFYPDDLR